VYVQRYFYLKDLKEHFVIHAILNSPTTFPTGGFFII